MKEIDTDDSGDIDAEEFYQWMGKPRCIASLFADIHLTSHICIHDVFISLWKVVNAKSEGSANEAGTKKMSMRNERLEVGKDGIDDHLMDLLEELGVGAVVQKVTHPLHSAFGRTLYDHCK